MPGHDRIHRYWFKKSFPSTTDWLSKGIDTKKKQT